MDLKNFNLNIKNIFTGEVLFYEAKQELLSLNTNINKYKELTYNTIEVESFIDDNDDEWELSDNIDLNSYEINKNNYPKYILSPFSLSSSNYTLFINYNSFSFYSKEDKINFIHNSFLKTENIPLIINKIKVYNFSNKQKEGKKLFNYPERVDLDTLIYIIYPSNFKIENWIKNEIINNDFQRINSFEKKLLEKEEKLEKQKKLEKFDNKIYISYKENDLSEYYYNMITFLSNGKSILFKYDKPINSRGYLSSYIDIYSNKIYDNIYNLMKNNEDLLMMYRNNNLYVNKNFIKEYCEYSTKYNYFNYIENKKGIENIEMNLNFNKEYYENSYDEKTFKSNLDIYSSELINYLSIFETPFIIIEFQFQYLEYEGSKRGDRSHYNKEIMIFKKSEKILDTLMIKYFNTIKNRYNLKIDSETFDFKNNLIGI